MTSDRIEVIDVADDAPLTAAENAALAAEDVGEADELKQGLRALARDDADPQFTRRVMACIEQRNAGAWQRMRGRMRHTVPRRTSVLAMAPVALAAVIAACWAGHKTYSLRLARASETSAQSEAFGDLLPVAFELTAPGAAAVAVSGDFNRWGVVPMQNTGRGVWRVSIPLPPGRHAYKFRVDGRSWVLDPRAEVVPNGVGGPNSVLRL